MGVYNSKLVKTDILIGGHKSATEIDSLYTSYSKELGVNVKHLSSRQLRFLQNTKQITHYQNFLWRDSFNWYRVKKNKNKNNDSSVLQIVNKQRILCTDCSFLQFVDLKTCLLCTITSLSLTKTCYVRCEMMLHICKTTITI